jgi:hypothetical protein
MKRLTFILFLFCSVLQAQTTWYIDPGGNDVSGVGTSGSPWRTLYKATHTVPALLGDPGDKIHVNSGTYNEVQQSELEPDISIEGEGYNSYIVSGYAGSSFSDAVIEFAGGSNTTQHISGIRLRGNIATTDCGISIINRDNVTINNCWLDDFKYIGIYMDTGEDNLVTGCTITNCGGNILQNNVGHHPNILFTSQTGSDIVNCTITQTARGSTSNGEGVSGYEKNTDCSMHGCTIITQTPYTDIWTFGVELWDVENFDFYNNTVNYGLALGGHTGTVNADVHDNLFGPVIMPSVANVDYGLQFENYWVSGVTVRKNTFRNLQRSILICHYNAAGMYVEDMDIYSNKFYNCGVSGVHSGAGIYFQTGDNSDLNSKVANYYDNINIINNTIVADATWGALYGILLPAQASSSVTNITVKNNAIYGFYSYAVYAYRQDNKYSLTGIAGLNITYNDFYSNGSNAASFTFTPTYYTSTPNITTNPSFTSDYHLQFGSGNIGTGTVIGSPVLLDFAGDAWDSPPSIGCYKYGAVSIVIPVVTTTAITGISSTGAASGGNVTSDGGALVTARGICWSTSQNPTTASPKTTNGTGIGVFISAITGLTEGLRYYVRAYATNSVGTAYGAELSFVAVTGYSLPGTGQLLKTGNVMVKIGNVLVKY